MKIRNLSIIIPTLLDILSLFVLLSGLNIAVILSDFNFSIYLSTLELLGTIIVFILIQIFAYKQQTKQINSSKVCNKEKIFSSNK